MISTRGRYALRVMIEIAQQKKESYIPLKEISKRQEISQKYLESIMTILSKNNFIEAMHGKGGGYRLNRDPKDYKVGEILRLTEGSLAPVSCLECGAKPCQRAGECKTLPMWKNLNEIVSNYLDGVTIADLVDGKEV